MRWQGKLQQKILDGKRGGGMLGLSDGISLGEFLDGMVFKKNG